MEIIECNGKKYFRQKGKWFDDKTCMAVPNLQGVLDGLYSEQIDCDSLSADELLDLGREAYAAESYLIATKYYEAAFSSADQQQMFGLLSTLSSCYRKIGKPEKSIELYEYARLNFGERFISEGFCTSVAAAFCDLKKHEEAKKMANKAYAKSGGKGSGELNGLYGRIRKETTGSGKYDGDE